MARTFRAGGIHPPEHKSLTADKAVEFFTPPKEVVIPLVQHLGAPCAPKVQKRDIVKIGQVIGESDQFVSAPVHATVSGKVSKIEPRPHPIGRMVDSVIIENDGEETWEDGVLPSSEPVSLEVDPSLGRDYFEAIRRAGLVGMGGAAFPTHVKLSPPKDCTIDTLIINGAECEPYLTSDHRLMVEHPAEIVAGIRMLMAVLGVRQCRIGIEMNKPDAIEILRRETADFDGIEVVPCELKYPQGGEKQLIDAALGRIVPSGKLPMHVGVVVQNVGTAFAAFEAVRRNKPLIERVVTVTGSAVRNPRNLLARVGTPFLDVLQACGYEPHDGNRVVMGGPMMGKAQFSLEVPVVKGTSGILTLAPEDGKGWVERACVRCGRCVSVCPMGLEPSSMAREVEHDEFDHLVDEGLMDCMECGSCAYVCPSHRPLVHWMRLGKYEVKDRQSKAKS